MRTKRRKILILAVFVALVLVVLGILYARYITELLTSESQMHLSEVATQGAASVQRQIARDFDILDVLADGSISDPAVPLSSKMERIKKQAYKFGLFRIGLVDLEGNATTSDDHEFSVKDREFFKAAVRGERFISEPIIDKVDGVTPGIVYAVPVYHNGVITSVLFSGYELASLTDRIDISFYHESGIAFIVDSDANVLLHPIEERNNTNIAEIAETRNKPSVVEGFKQNLKSGKSGVTHFVMRTEDRFFAYAPIKGANDWFLFASLPVTSVLDRSQKVIIMTVLLLVGILVMLTLIACYIAVSKKRANAKIVKLAYYDTLTGAANGERFKLSACECLRQFDARGYTLLNFDVKQFRYLNNNLGYDAGNALLIHIANCIERVLEKDETFARVGTDQFIILFLSRESEEETRRYIRRLSDEIAMWAQPSGGYYSVQLAFGVYRILDKDEDILAAIEKSNIARKAAKDGYATSVAIYDAKMQQRIDRDIELETATSSALENGEFKLFIQPKYSLESGEIVGGEALVRWIKADGTMIMPNEFISLFEQTGAISDMDLCMLTQLCAFQRGELDRGIPAVPISINQSRRYMYSPNYVEVIREKLRENNVPAHMIELEITENLVYTDIDKLICVLEVLHKAGFSISLDDFGSGYSSLNVLKKLQVDTLKLDRFMLSKTLDSEREKTVVASIIRMAKELNMSVVAEGVETYEQVVFLRECGCETAQGYYYSKPVPAERFEELLRGVKK